MEFYFDSIALSKQSIFLMVVITRVCKILWVEYWYHLIYSIISIRDSSHMIWILYISSKKRKDNFNIQSPKKNISHLFYHLHAMIVISIFSSSSIHDFFLGEINYKICSCKQTYQLQHIFPWRWLGNFKVYVRPGRKYSLISWPVQITRTSHSSNISIKHYPFSAKMVAACEQDP